MLAKKFSSLSGGTSHIFSAEFVPPDPGEQREKTAFILRNFVHANDPGAQEALRAQRMRKLTKRNNGQVAFVVQNRLEAHDVHRQIETNTTAVDTHGTLGVRRKNKFKYNPEKPTPRSGFGIPGINSAFCVKTKPLYIPTMPTIFDEETLRHIAGLVPDAESQLDGDAFVKFCFAMSQAETPVRLQTMIANRLLPYCFEPLSDDSKMVSSFLVSALGEHLLAKLALNNSFVVDSTAFVSSDFWPGVGIDAGTGRASPIRLANACKTYMTKARAVLKKSEAGSNSTQPYTSINRVYDPQVRHVLMPMCIKHGDPKKADHWVLVVVYIERARKVTQTTFGSYKKIRCLHVVVFDPWKSADDPYVPQAALLNTARVAVDFLYQVEELVTLRTRNKYTHAVRFARGKQTSGNTCGLWVMAAMQNVVENLFGKKLWLRGPSAVKIDCLATVLRTTRLTSEWRCGLMHDMATTMLGLFADFPLVKHLRSPFQTMIDNKIRLQKAKEAEERENERTLALLREQHRRLSSGRANRGRVAVPQIPQSIIDKHKKAPRKSRNAAVSTALRQPPSYSPSPKRKWPKEEATGQRKAAKGLMSKIVITRPAPANEGVDLDGFAL